MAQNYPLRIIKEKIYKQVSGLECSLFDSVMSMWMMVHQTKTLTYREDGSAVMTINPSIITEWRRPAKCNGTSPLRDKTKINQIN